MNLHTLSAYIQVAILKHVIEINEDVVMKTLQRAIYASHMWTTFLLPVDGKFSRKPEYDHWQIIIYPLKTGQVLCVPKSKLCDVEVRNPTIGKIYLKTLSINISDT